jgi:hypothetical protein
MFDTPIDAWYAWLGLSVATLAVFGVATAFPATPAPDAAGLAETIDPVATSDYDTTARHPVTARTVRLGPRRVGLRNDAGTTHATLAYPVVPVEGGTPLDRVLRGAAPPTTFESPQAFARAAETARERPPQWRPAGEAVVVRHLTWVGVDVTLVGTVSDGEAGPVVVDAAAQPQARGERA